jgi:hypothetical protein
MRKITVAIVLIAALGCLTSICCGGSWPQFRGPNRDGKSAETGLLKEWPAGGPMLLWSVGGLGIGFSSVAIADGLICTTGMIDGEGFLFAYDPNARPLWRESYGSEWKGSHKGARTTPSVDGDRVYVFSGVGVMACFNAKTGKKIWEVDTLKEFNAKNIRWGMTGSPLIDGNKVYCTPGGQKGAVVALDKMTGRTVWTSPGSDELSAYSSLIWIERGGNRLLVNTMQRSIVGVSADDGRLLWRIPYQSSVDTAANTPVYSNGSIYVTSVVEREATIGGLMLELSPDGNSVQEKWSDQTLDCHHGGVVLVDGYLYGSNFKDIAKGDWVCLDWDTGKVMYETAWNGNKGSLVYADGMLYCYDENTGDVALLKASHKAFEIVSSFRVTAGSGEHWAHPAISDGRLYIRHGDALIAYDIKKQ